MLISNIDKYNSIFGKIDAILIVDKNDIVEYSSIINPKSTYMRTEDVIGRNIYELYRNLTPENSTHAKVMKTGIPVINEKQLIVGLDGNSFTMIANTFPIEEKGEIIGTIDLSFNLTYGNEEELKKAKDRPLYTADNIITHDPNMLLIKEKILKVSKNDSPVMVIGESGTGKELVVEAIHRASHRSSGPFISLNCAAIPDSLMESTLFGTVKGSFTGAENRKGVFELADGGTLFLDELNSMSMDLQAKLLKAVEEQKYMKVGGEKYINVDVRIISAMNAEPRDVLSEKKLRSDLFYRLGVFQLNITPLRERKGDILLLADHFVSEFNRSMGKNIKGLNELTKKVFQDYSWPGNIRELRNVIESSFNICDSDEIRIADIPDYMLAFDSVNDADITDDLSKGLPKLVEEFERDIILKALSRSRNLTEAADLLKMTRQAIKYKMNKYGIEYNK